MASDKFSSDVTGAAVAKVCEVSGFDAIEESAHEVLTQLALNQVEALGRLAKNQADMNGRTLVNLQDIMGALRNLRPRTGFESQASVGGLAAFAADPKAAEASLSVEVASFPARRNNRVALPSQHTPDPIFPSPSSSSSSARGDGAPLAHVPPFAPALPPAYTYRHTLVNATQREKDPRRILEQQTGQQRSVRATLNTLSQRQRRLANARDGMAPFGTVTGSRSAVSGVGFPSSSTGATTTGTAATLPSTALGYSSGGMGMMMGQGGERGGIRVGGNELNVGNSVNEAGGKVIRNPFLSLAQR